MTVEFTLPGTWTDLFIGDPIRSERAIQHHVNQTVGRRDERAQQRRTYAEHLRTIVTDAAGGDADSVYLAREIAPGVPLPMSLFVRVVPSVWKDQDDLLGWVTSIPVADGSQRESIESEVASVELPSGTTAVVRIRLIRSLKDSQWTESGDESLRFDYWLLEPSDGRVALFSFTTAMLDLRASLRDFCDAVVATASWPDVDVPGLATAADAQSGSTARPIQPAS